MTRQGTTCNQLPCARLCITMSSSSGTGLFLQKPRRDLIRPSRQCRADKSYRKGVQRLEDSLSTHLLGCNASSMACITTFRTLFSGQTRSNQKRQQSNSCLLKPTGWHHVSTSTPAGGEDLDLGVSVGLLPPGAIQAAPPL